MKWEVKWIKDVNSCYCYEEGRDEEDEDYDDKMDYVYNVPLLLLLLL